MVPETVALKSHLRISADMGQKFIFLSQDSNVKIDSTHFIKSGSQGAKKQSGSPKVDFLKSKEKFGAVIKFSLIDDNIFERGLVIKGTQGSGQFVVEIQINPPTDSLEGDCGKPVIKIIQ